MFLSSPSWLLIPSSFEPNSERSDLSSVSTSATLAMLQASMVSSGGVVFGGLWACLASVREDVTVFCCWGFGFLRHSFSHKVDQVFKSLGLFHVQSCREPPHYAAILLGLSSAPLLFPFFFEGQSWKVAQRSFIFSLRHHSLLWLAQKLLVTHVTSTVMVNIHQSPILQKRHINLPFADKHSVTLTSRRRTLN